MNDLHCRALRALGWIEIWTGEILCYQNPVTKIVFEEPDLPSDAELIGLLMLELDRLTDCWTCSKDEEHSQVTGVTFDNRPVVESASTSFEALVLAVEAAKEKDAKS